MTLSELRGKRIALWGFGREGATTLAFLKDQFPAQKFIIVNNQPVDDGDYYIAEDDLLENLDEFDVIVKSPGISYYHDAVSKMIEHGIEVTSATNIWFALPKTGKVIAITGSNGKSTTSAMLHHILKSQGLKVELGGNIGTALLSLGGGADYYVVELSSYQTCDLEHEPDIAVLLNLHPEHIQWHQSHEQYYHDKCNLLRRGAAINIVNHFEPRTHDITANAVRFNNPDAIHFKGDNVFDGEVEIGSLGGFPLLGDHNKENLCAALSICKALDLDLKACLAASFGYAGLPHRLQIFGPIGERMYVNDSISTDPEATIAALNALSKKQITLIAGGEDREQDYSDLCALIDASDNVHTICVYETGPRLFDQIKSEQKNSAASLEDAMTLAKEITPIDGYILLSPASPSYDTFKDFEQRGELFMTLART